MMDYLFYILIGICPIAGFWIGYTIFKNKKEDKQITISRGVENEQI